VANVATGEKDLAFATTDTAAQAAGGGRGRGALQGWSHDGKSLYFADNSRTKWEHALVRYDRTTKQPADLVRDTRHYNGLRSADDGSTTALTIAQGNHVPDIYVGDASLGGLKRVVESNPQLAAKPIARTELISYLDADGQNRYGVLRYPTNY